MSSPLAVGVDGCRNAWLAVHRDGEALAFRICVDASALLRNFPAPAVIAVDVPIGLRDSGDSRAAEREARRILRGTRASSVFPTPVRAVLRETEYRKASDRQRQICGKGLSKQTWFVACKTRDWDDILQTRPRERARVFEVHPEVCFAMLAGGTGLANAKKTVEGQRQRFALLTRHFGERRIAAIASRFDREVRRAVAQRDDLHDALVALVTAERLVAGTAQSIPSPPETDATGLRMAMWT